MVQWKMMDDASEKFTPPPIPAPPEVRIRTMESDIQGIATGGGSAPIERLEPSLPRSSPQIPRGFGGNGFNPKVLIILGMVAILGILVFLGYFFVYPLLSISNSEESTPVPVVPLSVVLPPAPLPRVEHESFFRISPASQVDFIFTSGPAKSPEDLETFSQKITRLVGGVSENFFEVAMLNDAQTHFVASDFFKRIDAEVFHKSFLEEHFSKDFTAFVYKEKGGYFPGYVLALEKNATPVLVQPEISQKLELASRSKIKNLFLKHPGEPLKPAFDSVEVMGKSVKVLPFQSGEFSYAWFNNSTLVLSTSRKGLEEAFGYIGR